jgi:hypothetical protein
MEAADPNQPEEVVGDALFFIPYRTELKGGPLLMRPRPNLSIASKGSAGS